VYGVGDEEWGGEAKVDSHPSKVFVSQFVVDVVVVGAAGDAVGVAASGVVVVAAAGAVGVDMVTAGAVAVGNVVAPAERVAALLVADVGEICQIDVV